MKNKKIKKTKETTRTPDVSSKTSSLERHRYKNSPGREELKGHINADGFYTPRAVFDENVKKNFGKFNKLMLKAAIVCLGVMLTVLFTYAFVMGM